MMNVSLNNPDYSYFPGGSSNQQTPSAKNDTFQQLLNRSTGPLNSAVAGRKGTVFHLLKELRKLLTSLGIELSQSSDAGEESGGKLSGFSISTKDLDHPLALNSLQKEIKELMNKLHDLNPKAINAEDKKELINILEELYPLLNIYKPMNQSGSSLNGMVHGSKDSLNAAQNSLKKELNDIWSSFKSFSQKKSNESTAGEMPENLKMLARKWLNIEKQQKSAEAHFNQQWQEITNQATPEQKAAFTHLLQTVRTSDNSSIQDPKLDAQLKTLWQTFHKNVEGIAALDSHLSLKQAAAVKETLIKWSALQSEQQNKQSFLNKWSTAAQEGTKIERQLFTRLINNMQNRMTLPTTYLNQSQISTKDIGKWVKQYLSNVQPNESAEQPSRLNTAGPSLPMAKMEQFIINVKPTDTGQPSSSHFMKEMENAVTSSRFLMNKSGDMQLNIKLKPGNLGDLTLTVTKMNGEMAIKILVSSQAAKEMLDSNMHQLRHMFSPQQVIIEKSDQQYNGQAYLTDDSKQEQSFEGQKEEQSHHSGNKEEQQPSQEELSFKEIMNEKV
ncbi:flagellar hook-length control protein FliK [Halobacillus salinarum]|uniref:Flagellar hook-length control protein FliK n=1 Tax=Halobacillus salinarum TaxID=2932257 RepID=A0ABY4EFX6_9BACI|nr:flagellar hook-length control protein FliK [Halobacillus salinarum]UOQ43051.1 flagellar hook-length control protein FliK [Halobacillus salinarum]